MRHITHVRQKKIYSGIDALPKGIAPDTIVEGCAVLEGGAFRGVYGEGVLDAMMENGLNLSCTIGVSAGALNGLNYVAGNIGRAARTNLRFRHDQRYVGLTAMRHNHGLIGFDFAFHELNRYEPLNVERLHKVYPLSRTFLSNRQTVTVTFPADNFLFPIGCMK